MAGAAGGPGGRTGGARFKKASASASDASKASASGPILAAKGASASAQPRASARTAGSSAAKAGSSGLAMRWSRWSRVYLQVRTRRPCLGMASSACLAAVSIRARARRAPSASPAVPLAAFSSSDS